MKQQNLLLFTFLLAIVDAKKDTSPGLNSNYTPPPFWTEHWSGHNANLSLVFSDDHIAFYFDQDEYSEYHQSWPLKFISDAWRYAKNAYGPLGPDPILYIVIHKKVQECIQSKINSYFDEQFDNRNVMDCGQNIFQDRYRKEDIRMENVLMSIAVITLRVTKNTGKWPAYQVSQWAMSEILVYDLALGLGLDSFASTWVDSSISKNLRNPKSITYAFRDWFYPIYMNFGGYKILNNFLTILNENFPRSQNDYLRNLTLGEFIHFWSGAAGEDLSVFAVPAFKWKNSEDNLTLVHAKESFPNITYADTYAPSLWHKPQGMRKEYWNDHSAELTLVYADHHTVFYFDGDMNMSTSWPFKFLSDAWKFAKEVYGPLGSDPMLYVVLHAKKYENCAPRWRHGNHRLGPENLIDCGPTFDPSQNYDSNGVWVNSTFNTYLLAREISHIILREAIWKSFWSDANGTVPLQDMITLDVLYSLGWNEEKMRWVKETLKSPTFVSHLNPEALKLRNWYLYIYDNFGGARIVRNYFRLMHSHWPGSLPYRKSMHLGEIVHFWSAAAGINLWHSATKELEWTVQDHFRFFKAQSDFSLYNYSNTFLETTMAIPSLKWKEHWMNGKTQHNEELTLVYVDFYVAFYFDSHVDISVNWPFQIISDSWRYAHRFYGPFGEDPMLYIVLHESDFSNWFTGSRGKTFSDPDYENRTVIDCGISTGEWKKPEYLDPLLRQLAERIIRGAKATGNWPLKNIDSYYRMLNILIFDIYMGTGRTNDAVRFHKGAYGWDWDGWFNFKRWHYKMYAKYGRTRVLSRLFSLLHSYWPKSDNGYDYAEQMNTGEFVHFWSGAAGVNLMFMIPERNTKQEIEYHNATIDYPMITYRASTKEDEDNTIPLTLTEDWFDHSEYLFLVYSDSFVVTYFDADVPQNITWPFKLLSRSWSYLQKSYDLIPQTSHASLHIVLHAKRHNLCRTLWNTPSKSNNVTNIIDCGRSSGESWITESGDNVDYLMQEFGHIVQQSANQTDEKENYVSALTNVMVFDIYLSIGRIKEAHRWLVMKIREKEKQSAGEIYWVRDWYIPIYTRYGGVSVLNSYSKLVLKYGSMNKDEGAKFSIGKILHFWSAASGNNLLSLADKAFSWTERYQHQFDIARKQLPSFKYADYNYSLSSVQEEPDQKFVVTVVVLVTITVIVIIIALALCLLHRRRIKRLQEQIRDLSNDELVEFFEGIANPAGTDGNALVDSRPFNTNFEISPDQLDIYPDQILGCGEFGIVYRGNIILTVENEVEVTTVAVKTIKPNANVSLFKSLLSELKVLCYLDNQHENVVSLLGTVTAKIKKRELFVALEFCEKGDLLSHLKKCRDNFRDLFNKKNKRAPTLDESEANNPICLSTLDLLSWARQISSGMSYISSRNVIHGDVACRNILLTANSVAKISDFGLSRQLANYSKYTKKSQTLLPWKWLAIECLQDMHFSVQSDVWAFGVTLFEIFSLGQSPFAGCRWNQNFVDRLVAGERVKSPSFGNKEIYTIMMDCMKKKPEDRISFAQMTQKFGEILRTLRPLSDTDSCCIYSEFQF